MPYLGTSGSFGVRGTHFVLDHTADYDDGNGVHLPHGAPTGVIITARARHKARLSVAPALPPLA